jgi:hypothetical protein
MHGDGSCLSRGIIFAVGNNKEMHLSPKKAWSAKGIKWGLFLAACSAGVIPQNIRV